jgi:ElaA protein
MFRKTFEELSKDELYALAKMRQQVFIVEQNSIYSDLDDYDQAAIHYLGFDQLGKLTVYARYRQEDNSKEIKIERVVLDKSIRGKGKGKRLINMMIDDIKNNFPETDIVLSSQLDVCPFYRSLGFTTQGESYDDGGIEHISMFYQR